MPSGTPAVVTPRGDRWAVMIGNKEVVDTFETRQDAFDVAERVNSERRGPGVVVLNSEVRAIQFVSLDPAFWTNALWTDQIRAPVVITPVGAPNPFAWKVSIGEFKEASRTETKSRALDRAGVIMGTEDRPCTVVYSADGSFDDINPNVDFWEDRYGAGAIG